MREADYYPAGAYNDPNAPYNQPVIPERDFDLTISQSLSKDVTVCTDDYTPEYDEEDGRIWPNTDNTDWDKAFEEEHYTPLQLIQKFKETLKEQLDSWEGVENTFAAQMQIRKIEHLIEECEGWTEDETEIFGS